MDFWDWIKQQRNQYKQKNSQALYVNWIYTASGKNFKISRDWNSPYFLDAVNLSSENVEKTEIIHCLIITFIKMDSFYVAEKIYSVELSDREPTAIRMKVKITMMHP